MNQSNNKLEFSEIIQRFIDDSYSEKDVDTIIKYIKDQDSDKALKKICSYNWYHRFDKPGTIEENESFFSTILDRIHHRLNLTDYGILISGYRGTVRRIITTSVNVFYRISAIIVIGLILGSIFYFNVYKRSFPEDKVAYSEIITPIGSKIKIDLPDGSMAWLNAGTILKYPQNFGRRSRELFLTGEAYFNVTKENKHPFILKTSDVSIHVLGTSFNVLAYEDDPYKEITLETGKLDIYQLTRDGSSYRIADLRAGDRLVFDNTSKKIAKYSGNIDKYTGWKDGMMIFRNDPLEVIVSKIERWYNVEIEIFDKELADSRFTATFTDETLTQVLNLLAVAFPMEYTISHREKQLDNTFSKKKVILKLKNKNSVNVNHSNH